MCVKRSTKAMVLMLAGCLMFGLTACNSVAQPKTEEQILEDIQAEDSYINNYDLKVDSFLIIKRQTNSDDKNDFVWCEVTASNEDFSYSAAYNLTYNLYNEGWLLEGCNQENASIIPTSFPTQTQDEAMELVREYFQQHKTEDVAAYQVARQSSLQKLSDLSYAYYFQITAINKYGFEMFPSDYAVLYQFDPVSGWISEVSENVNIRWG